MPKEIIIKCEESQEVMKAFRSKGFNAYSCDIEDCSGGFPEFHIKQDALTLPKKYAFTGAHPPCTFLANSGSRWLYDTSGNKVFNRWVDLENAVRFFHSLREQIEIGYLENPVPHKYARDGFYSVISGEWVSGIGKYTQLVQPWQFGHKEMKATCFWLIGLPLLKSNDIVGPPPKDPEERKKWAKIHRAPPSADRQKIRSKTYPGIASAMAEQWGNFLLNQ